MSLPYIADLEAEKAANKYGAKRTSCAHGHSHASKREAKRCAELHLLLRAGEIDALVYEPQYWFEINGVQVKHEKGRRVGYKPDFGYLEKGQVVVEDVKGMVTEAAQLRMTMFRALFPEIELRVLR